MSDQAWPEDALTLTYGEMRQLIALHLDQLGHTLGRVAPWEDAHRAARAMRDGETPLRVSEVLDRDPAQQPEEPPINVSDADLDPRGPHVVRDRVGWQRWAERSRDLIARGLAASPAEDQIRSIAELCSYAYQVGRMEQRDETEERARPGLADDPTVDGFPPGESINLGPRRRKPGEDTGYLLTDAALAELPRLTREKP